MIETGCLILWILTLWIYRHRIGNLIEELRKKDIRRQSNLRFKLHRQFIFEESGKFRKLGIWFAGPIILFAIQYFNRIRFQKQLLLMLPSLSSMLRSGHGLERSLDQLRITLSPPMCNELGLVLKEIKLGTTLENALGGLHHRFPSENMQMFLHAVSISRKLGTSLSQIMDQITQSILQKEKLKQQISALTAQGKVQSWMAVAMPFFIAIALKFIAPEYFNPLYSTTLGKFCIGYCLISLIIGLSWIHGIANKEYL